MSLQLHLTFVLHKAKQNKEGYAPLVIRFTYQKQRREIASGFLLTAQEWEKIKVGKRFHAEHLKNVLSFMDVFRVKVYQIATTLQLENRLDLETLIELCLGKQKDTVTLLQLFTQHRDELQKRTGIDRSKATLDKYRYTEDKVKAFLRFRFQRTDIDVNKLDPSFIQLFYDYMLLECRIHHNTIAKYCKNLKRILNFGREKGLVKENPFALYQVGYQNIDRSYLTASEMAVLQHKTMPISRLQIIKDLFLFQCYTGLAFADLAQIQKVHLVEGNDGKPWLVIKRQKTKVTSTVPLLEPALDILNRYASSPDVQKGRLLPDISNQKLNAYLKEIADLCGIQKRLTSHVGRRTFATTVALANGVSMEAIAKMLGHTTTKMTTLYAVVTDQKLSEEMADLQRKLSKNQ